MIGMRLLSAYVSGHCNPEAAFSFCIKDDVKMDYVMANPPFNVDKVKSEAAMSAGRLPFGMPSINAAKEFGNANYLWISYFYAYLNEKGRAGFVMASSATDSSGKDRDIREKLVQTGHVDVMMSVGNNFFYTKSLPCSLWFFDKGKPEALQDKVLFIDARNYYTVVDRTLNEWSEWQLKNLNAIVWLYRGQTKKYCTLLQEYQTAIKAAMEHCAESAQELLRYLTGKPANMLTAAIEDLQKTEISVKNLNVVKEAFQSFRQASDNAEGDMLRIYESIPADSRKTAVKEMGFPTYKALEKKLEILAALTAQEVEKSVVIVDEVQWLYEKFGEGEYRDIPGLCKVASRTEIAEKNYSLTPGAYVGVAAVEDDGVDFAQRMAEIHAELLSLQAESNALMDTISKNMKEMGL